MDITTPTVVNVNEHVNESLRTYFLLNETVILEFVDNYKNDFELVDVDVNELKEEIKLGSKNFEEIKKSINEHNAEKDININRIVHKKFGLLKKIKTIVPQPSKDNIKELKQS